VLAPLRSIGWACIAAMALLCLTRHGARSDRVAATQLDVQLKLVEAWAKIEKCTLGGPSIECMLFCRCAA